MGIINNSKTDPNKILPMHYMWAREHYKSGVANNWTPEEVSMQKDVEQWKSDTVLSDLERRLILWNDLLGDDRGEQTRPSFLLRNLCRLPRLARTLRLAFYRANPTCYNAPDDQDAR